ncbi:MAG: L-threonylcarbamoyladenylate synthase, partial [bacterium]
MAPDAAGLDKAARLIKSGSVVAMPTETVYGLAADAFNATACARVFEIKARPSFDPLIVHLAESAWLGRVAESNPLADRLARAFWPGPLTLVLPRRPEVPGIVTSGLDTVAVRVPAHPVALALLRLVDRPLAAPSANRFGALSPTRSEHVERGLGSRVACVL